MYIFLVVLIIIASVLIIFAVLAQNPKSGMAANLGASNQVMGARQTTNVLEKFTWTMAIVIVVLSLLASVAMSSYAAGNKQRGNDAILDEVTTEGAAIPANQLVIPAAEGTDANSAEE